VPTAPFLGSICTRKRREEVNSPFHKTLLSSKTCGFMSCANHTSPRARQCQLPSIVKDRHSRHQLPTGASPLRAERSVSLEPTLRKIKNPAPSAGLIRLSSGPRSATVRRMNSKLDLLLSGARNQSHLCETAGRLGIRTSPRPKGHHRHQESISTNFFSSSISQLFFRVDSVEFLSFCGKEENTVERLSFRPFPAVVRIESYGLFCFGL
jgi:hypothetical protein